MAEWWEIGLFVIGLGLLAVEIFVTPGFGVLGIAGLLLMGGGLLLTMTTFEQGSLPSTAGDFLLIRNRFFLLTGVAFSVLTCAAFLARWLPKVPILRGVILQDNLGLPPAAGIHGIAPTGAAAIPPGTPGFAATDLRPSGKVDFAGVRTDVIAEREFVPKGERVVATGMSGSQVSVRRA